VKVIVDTDVWSEAFRKPKGKESKQVTILKELILDVRVEMIGMIRLEILSGIRELERFEKFSKSLEAFSDKQVETSSYILAAKLLNLCRKNGIQGSLTDFIICACSIEWKTAILTKDKDYSLYSKYIPIELI
jgi:predicted nucleic acid-binding protein